MILLTLLFAVKVCVLVQGRYVLEVRLNGYENRKNSCIDCQPEGRTLHGCCDDHRHNNGDCSGDRPCDSYFIFCLRPFGSRRERYDCQTLYDDTRVTLVNNNDGPVDFTNETVLGLENPFLLPGLTEKYEGVQLYIAIYDKDTGTNNRVGANEPDDLVDVVVINHNQSVSLQSQRESLGGFVSINVNITVLCAQNSQGADCTECVPGFTGPNCDEVDDCVGVTCSGNGLCVDGVGTFQCFCDPEFIGEMCQTNINDCVGVNCSGNGLCVDGVNSFTCECMTGYGGTLCSEALASDSVSTSGSRLILAGALGGGIAGALLLILLLLATIISCCLSRKSKVISHSGPLAQQGDSDVTGKRSTQHIIQSDQNLMFELKSNEAYDSTTHYIPTEDNVAYGQTAPQIPTEDNVAYGHWDRTLNSN